MIYNNTETLYPEYRNIPLQFWRVFKLARATDRYDPFCLVGFHGVIWKTSTHQATCLGKRLDCLSHLRHGGHYECGIYGMSSIDRLLREFGLWVFSDYWNNAIALARCIAYGVVILDQYEHIKSSDARIEEIFVNDFLVRDHLQHNFPDVRVTSKEIVEWDSLGQLKEFS